MVGVRGAEISFHFLRPFHSFVLYISRRRSRRSLPLGLFSQLVRPDLVRF